MSVPEAVVYNPRTLDELDHALAEAPGPVTYVAGATDVMVHPARWNSCRILVDLSRVSELHAIERHEDGLLIGAATPVTKIINDSFAAGHYPLLKSACRQIGSVQIQNRATLGGNIANASPAGDTLPPLSVYNAELWLGPRRDGDFERTSISELMLGPGRTALTNRYIAFIRLPELAPEACGYFRKIGQRYSLAISKASLALLAWKDGRKLQDVRICAGSVSAVVRRAAKTEALLNGMTLDDATIERAARQLADEVAPISDIRSSERYRRDVCANTLRDALYGLRPD